MVKGRVEPQVGITFFYNSSLCTFGSLDHWLLALSPFSLSFFLASHGLAPYLVHSGLSQMSLPLAMLSRNL